MSELLRPGIDVPIQFRDMPLKDKLGIVLAGILTLLRLAGLAGAVIALAPFAVTFNPDFLLWSGGFALLYAAGTAGMHTLIRRAEQRIG